MSTRASLYYGRFGHVFMEQGECVFYWTAPGSPYWRRLWCQWFWRRLNRSRWFWAWQRMIRTRETAKAKGKPE